MEAPRDVTVEASATGYHSASGVLTVNDDDLPAFSLSLSADTVSEAGGAAATTATISRGLASPRSLSVILHNSNPDALAVPERVTIPAGQAEVSVPLSPVDNTLVDGPRQAVLQAFAEATTSATHVAQTEPRTLTITDNDGPSLTVTLGRDLVAEGLPQATTITVSRNVANGPALTISLASSDASEATVPASVTLAANQSSATVPLATLDDGVSDGSQRVAITASAAGYTRGQATVTVTDVNRPDLVVSGLTLPAEADTESFVNVGYRVLNQGLAAAGTNWVTRVSLSADPAPGNDQLLVEYIFNGSLPVGQYFGQTRQVRLPLRTGRLLDRGHDRHGQPDLRGPRGQQHRRFGAAGPRHRGLPDDGGGRRGRGAGGHPGRPARHRPQGRHRRSRSLRAGEHPRARAGHETRHLRHHGRPRPIHGNVPAAAWRSRSLRNRGRTSRAGQRAHPGQLHAVRNAGWNDRRPATRGAEHPGRPGAPRESR